MKKLFLIVFVVISAVAAAATLKKVNDDANLPSKNLPTQTVETPRNAVVSNWD